MNYQIRLKKDGPWHRPRTGNGGFTACGEPIGVIHFTRDHELDTNLCPKCFTPHERDTGEMKKLEKEVLERSDADAFTDPEEPTDEFEHVIPPTKKPKPGGGDP